MSRIAPFAIAAVFGLLLTAGAAGAAPLSAFGGNVNVAGSLSAVPIHLKPGNHCHRHGHGKLCHGLNDYPALYPRADRKADTTHRHTRICRH